ncbi:MAG: YeeE/YedE thiosulfate transporter family protein [Pirellulales bacterium]
MKNPLKAKTWSPYIVGAGIGILSCFTFLSAGNPLGITTAFETTAAICEQQLLPDAAATNALIAKKPPKIDWGWMLLVGVFAGAWISSKLSGDRNAETVPTLWADRFGPSSIKRYAAAFTGGLLLLLGARLAGGCTSGHGISGSLQLAVSSWLFVLVAFSSGITTANVIFRRRNRSHV